MLKLINHLLLILLLFSCTKKKDSHFDLKIYKHSFEITKELIKKGDIKHQLFIMRVKESKNPRILDISKKLNEFDFETVSIISFIEEMKRVMIEMNSIYISSDSISLKTTSNKSLIANLDFNKIQNYVKEPQSKSYLWNVKFEKLKAKLINYRKSIIEKLGTYNRFQLKDPNYKGELNEDNYEEKLDQIINWSKCNKQDDGFVIKQLYFKMTQCISALKMKTFSSKINTFDLGKTIIDLVIFEKEISKIRSSFIQHLTSFGCFDDYMFNTPIISVEAPAIVRENEAYDLIVSYVYVDSYNIPILELSKPDNVTQLKNGNSIQSIMKKEGLSYKGFLSIKKKSGEMKKESFSKSVKCFPKTVEK